MKKSELVLNLVSIPIDALMLLLAGILSFYLRQNSIELVGPILYQLNFQDLISVVGKMIPILILIFAFFGLYNIRGTSKFSSEAGKVVVALSLGLLLVILFFFFDQTIFPSRFIILATWGLGLALVLLGRLLLRFFQEFLFYKGYGLHRLAIVSGKGSQKGVIEKIYQNPYFGYKIVSEIDFSDQNFWENLENLQKNPGLDEILQADVSLKDEDNLKLLEFSRNKGISFSFLPNLFDVQRKTVETYNLDQTPIISFKNTPLDGWGKVAKRTLDIVASLICIILTLPIFLIIALAIKLDSPGKIIYSALRGGRSKDFKFYKFRSMFSHLSVGEEYGGEKAESMRQELWEKNSRGGKSGPFLKIKDDPRVTKVGKFLRKTKLDEIPQFWNVLKGDMSMVGPRAHVLDEVERYRNRYARMFSIKPGIFGLSQIAQVSWPDLPFEEEIKQNTYYIENWSLWLDVKVLAKSFFLLFFSKKPKENY